MAQANCPNTADAQTKHKPQLKDPSEDRPAARGKSFCYSPAFLPAQCDAGNVCLQAGLHSRSIVTEQTTLVEVHHHHHTPGSRRAATARADRHLTGSTAHPMGCLGARARPRSAPGNLLAAPRALLTPWRPRTAAKFSSSALGRYNRMRAE